MKNRHSVNAVIKIIPLVLIWELDLYISNPLHVASTFLFILSWQRLVKESSAEPLTKSCSLTA